MKQIFLKASILLLLLNVSSCVGSKKFKALEDEKLKIEKTLLSTKQELSEAKRELNKFKDSSSSTTEEQSETIQGLQGRLEDTQNALDAAQGAAANCQEALHQLQKKAAQSDKRYKEEFEPLMKVKENLVQQNKSLKGIQNEIQVLLTANPEIIMKQSLNKDELVLTFDNSYLFASSSRNLSSNGRNGLYKLAEVLKKYPSIYIDINGHMPQGGDEKDNWKNSTRKTLSVLYTLTYKEVKPDRMRVIGYGEFTPVDNSSSPEAKNNNSRMEIILRYQNTKLLKLIPLK